ncbi:hypothetical protein CEXT_671001 [Caerostris extrusa]|uniref:Uncharacterized protein n=1 Tax=Caerostris extrusa TaxID=172846 RepID=A0AAV4RX50_CAEEX|nr:hypothetical protein CEXT_671001 [Caerostris extrusa]
MTVERRAAVLDKDRGKHHNPIGHVLVPLREFFDSEHHKGGALRRKNFSVHSKRKGKCILHSKGNQNAFSNDDPFNNADCRIHAKIIPHNTASRLAEISTLALEKFSAWSISCTESIVNSFELVKFSRLHRFSDARSKYLFRSPFKVGNESAFNAGMKSTFLEGFRFAV